MEKNKATLLWNDSYSVGVQEIDDQHKKLVEILNELVALIGSHPDNVNQKIEGTIAKINEYKTIHFATEEKYFQQFGFKGAEEHIQKHKEFNQRISELVLAIKENGEEGDLYELVNFMEDWFSDHLLNMDQKYVKCFKENGLK